MNNIISSDIEKNHSRRLYILAAGIILLLVAAALVFIYFTQESKPDSASEKIIREAVAAQLKKDPNELTDEDFADITKITTVDFFVLPELYDQPMPPWVVHSEFADIILLEKFINLNELDLTAIKYTDKNIPKWMKVLAKVGIFDIYKRFAIDLSPIKNLSSLRTLRLSNAQISDITPLKGLVNLKSLVIVNTHVSDLEPLSGLTNLQTLEISSTPVSSLEPIKNLKKLQRLGMINCRNITDEQIKDLKNSLPELSVIKDYVQ